MTRILDEVPPHLVADQLVAEAPLELIDEIGERLIRVTDGMIDRRLEDGGTLGPDRIQHALQRATSQTAASTAMAIQQAVPSCWRQPLEDHATIVVMAVD